MAKMIYYKASLKLEEKIEDRSSQATNVYIN